MITTKQNNSKFLLTNPKILGEIKLARDVPTWLKASSVGFNLRNNSKYAPEQSFRSFDPDHEL
jgi:hypothetical protein